MKSIWSIHINKGITHKTHTYYFNYPFNVDAIVIWSEFGVPLTENVTQSNLKFLMAFDGKHIITFSVRILKAQICSHFIITIIWKYKQIKSNVFTCAGYSPENVLTPRFRDRTSTANNTTRNNTNNSIKYKKKKNYHKKRCHS